MNGRRTAGFAGPNALTYQDILAWSVLTGTPIAVHEVRLITELDDVFLKEVSKMRDRESHKRGK